MLQPEAGNAVDRGQSHTCQNAFDKHRGVCVGDVDQLAPVGPGTVLTAAIQSGMIPVIDLREIFRQAKQSKIVTAAHDIQKGLFPQLSILPPDMLQVCNSLLS